MPLVGGRRGAPEPHHEQQLIGRVDEGVHSLRAHGAGAAVQVRQELAQGDDEVTGQGKLMTFDRDEAEREGERAPEARPHGSFCTRSLRLALTMKTTTEITDTSRP